MKKYYLHILGGGEIDSLTVGDLSKHPPKLSDIGLVLDTWPIDDLFLGWPVFFCTERLKVLIEYEGLGGVRFSPVNRLSKGANFDVNYPKAKLCRYWIMDFLDVHENMDFGIWNQMYLIVSKEALDFLRSNHVIHAEHDLINSDISEYFKSRKHLFWMKKT